MKKVSLQSGRLLQAYKGHTGPVTSIAFFQDGERKILISGSWDKTVRLWDTRNKDLISTTVDAHSDFVKTLFVIPSLKLLVSGGSDKLVRFWDLSSLAGGSLKSAGSISSHTRPIECLAGQATSDSTAILYTADTMGIIRAWNLQKEDGPAPRWKSTMRGELTHHRTRINHLTIGENLVWTASTDETVQIHPTIHAELAQEAAKVKVPKAIVHPTSVRALLPLSLTDLAEPYLLTVSGDALRVYDISTLDEPELLSETDIHWHDVTAIRMWYRKTVKEDLTHVEPWIVTTSLDQTIRRWRLADLLNPPPPPAKEEPQEEVKAVNDSGLTEEEERELAELLDED